MNNQINNKYVQNKWNRKRNTCHWKLAISRMLQSPLLFIFVLPIVVLAIFIWLKMELVIMAFNVPEIILPVYTISVRLIGVLIPLLLVWGLIDVIGTLTARKDEANIQMAFKEGELRNGSPILMYKRKDKKTGITVREWYTHIPMKLWVERQEDIEEAINISFTEKLRYGGNSDSNRIVMYSKKGRGTLINDSPIYDKDLEKDMETIV